MPKSAIPGAARRALAAILAPALLAAFAGAFPAEPAMAADDIETPEYEVLASEGPIEMRRYAPMIVAEITVEAESRDAASSKGFMPLAGYIFGNNGPSESIAMTAPVTTSPAGVPGGDGETIAMTAPVTTQAAGTQEDAASQEANAYTVRFMMPSRYTMETLPEPRDGKVELRELPARSFVTYRFTGERSDARVEEAEARLGDFIAKRGIERIGPSAVAGYDGPSTPTAERRWEVQVPIKGDAS